MADGLPEALCRELRHHRAEPEQAGGHVHAVAAHQREEAKSGRRCGSGRRRGPSGRGTRAPSSPRKVRPRSPVIASVISVQRRLCRATARLVIPQAKLESSRHAVSAAVVCRSKISRGPGPPLRAWIEHRIGGEEAGEQDDVGENEDPESVADHDALRCGAAGAMAGVLRHARRRARARCDKDRGRRAARCSGRSFGGLPLRLPPQLPVLQRRAAGGAVGAVEPGDFLRRDQHLVMIAPGEYDEGGVRAGKSRATPATRCAR